MKDIVIYGAGGLGKEIASLIRNINAITPTWNLIGFLDDNTDKLTWVGQTILGNHKYLDNRPETAVVIAIGSPETKKEIATKLTGHYFPTLVHPLAVLMDENSITIGSGCIITAGAILTSDIKIGEFTLINLNSTIGHDVSIGNYTSIMCGVNIAGNVMIGEEVFIGSGANIINNISIGDHAKVGAGSVVNKNVVPNKTVVGVPARPI